MEASLLLPLFLLLFMNLLSVIEVYRIHSSVAASLWEKGREETLGVYLREQAEDAVMVSGGSAGEGLQSFLGSYSGQNRIIKNLETYPVWEKIVTGGRSGFAVAEKVEDDGTVRIDCGYRIHPLFASLTPMTKTLENHYWGHAWVGYIHGRQEEEQGESYVYITESGTVYHRNRGCSYLNPSIRQVRTSEIETLRNMGGAIYYACPLCDAFQAGEMCYITDYGTGFHTSVGCSGLKRTIYEVKMSEVGGRGACSKCGG